MRARRPLEVAASLWALCLGCGSAVPVAGGDGASAGTTGETSGPAGTAATTTTAGTSTTGGRSSTAGGSTGQGTGDTTSSSNPATSSAGSNTSDGDSTSSSSSDSNDNPCGDFVCIPDVGPQPDDCSVWDQDCPPGEKCTAYANDGGSSWNDNRCVPVANDPVGVGEVCTVEEFPTSGFDDCELGTICIGQPSALAGTCVPFCGGDLASPTCPPQRTCVGGDVLPLCLLECDPLAPACGPGEGCFPVGDAFVCVGAGDVEATGPCAFANECVAGTACIFGGAAMDCPDEDVDGCCTPYCDLSAPACPGDAPCIPYDDVPGLDDLGLCAVPG